jgi:uncharacterized protein
MIPILGRLFIFIMKTANEASLLLKIDPAINANLLKAELYFWYGSAALHEYLSTHNYICKIKP